MSSLEGHIKFIRHAGQVAGDSQDLVEERIRFCEILVILGAVEVDDPILIRVVNFMCNPETWEDWKARGGDPGFHDESDGKEPSL